ncbi:MAG: hypothetical protein PUK70_06420 [Bacteroidales bacterium]|nr:hypothetical protein [Bacteroidales bacterium]MDY6001296.1 hypothetical protein [Candidatus Cryptobacteroides sp.]
MDFTKETNCKFTAGHVLELMAMFTFFAIKNCSNFSGGVLGQMFAHKKDIFYQTIAKPSTSTRTK